LIALVVGRADWGEGELVTDAPKRLDAELEQSFNRANWDFDSLLWPY
jgi:hypothetical protein